MQILTLLLNIGTYNNYKFPNNNIRNKGGEFIDIIRQVRK